MHTEAGRRPARLRGMTKSTGGGKVKLQVIGVDRCIVFSNMAGGAIRGGAGKSSCMTIQATGSQVRPRQCKGCGVVVENIVPVPGGVAGQTSIALVNIPSDTCMRIVGLGICMTASTGEHSIIPRVSMAVETLAPFPLVSAAVDGEMLSIVVKSGGNPAAFSVATGTVRRELGREVIRVVGIVVIAAMAGIAGIGGIIVVAVVTGRTVVGNRSMRPVQSVVIVVHRKARWCPARLRAVAHSAVIRNVQRNVVGISALIVVSIMATCAGIGSIGVISAQMAGRAIICHRQVSPREGEESPVVEGGRGPGVLRMAGGAVRRELMCSMVRIGGRVVIGSVAPATGIGRVVVVAVMAGRAIIGNGCVGAIQYIVIVVYVKTGGCPTGSCGVARRAISGQSQVAVVRIDALFEIKGVTGGAVGGSARVSVRMTLCAGGVNVSPCQRKSGGVVVKTAGGVTGRVTGQASGIFIDISSHSSVPFVRCRIQVANRAAVNGVVIRIRVAFAALRPGSLVLAAVNGEMLCIVILEPGRHPVGICRVTAGTVVGKSGSEVPGVCRVLEIGLVAGKAGVRCGGETAAGVTLRAVCDFMPFCQREEVVIDLVRLPAWGVGIVAVEAIG